MCFFLEFFLKKLVGNVQCPIFAILFVRNEETTSIFLNLIFNHKFVLL